MFRAIAKFEKVSYEQFFEDFVKAFNLSETRELEDGTHEIIDLHPIVTKVYDSIKLPKRATMGSAGYDFFVPIDLDIVPNTTVKVPTGIRCKMKKNYVLQIRSDFKFVAHIFMYDIIYFFNSSNISSASFKPSSAALIKHSIHLFSFTFNP